MGKLNRRDENVKILGLICNFRFGAGMAVTMDLSVCGFYTTELVGMSTLFIYLEKGLNLF